MVSQLSSLWLIGPSRSGKTTRLAAEFQQWVKEQRRDRAPRPDKAHHPAGLTPSALVLAANDDCRRQLGGFAGGDHPGNLSGDLQDAPGLYRR
ncbi:MAG: hypothetical protein HC890_15455 [Chloroflexaceae bacterium]|nr:hypothetical protein [Chloroflexaceae bacterium]